MNRVFVSLFIAMYTLEISGHLQNKAFKKNHLNNPSSTPLLPFLLSTRLQGLEPPRVFEARYTEHNLAELSIL